MGDSFRQTMAGIFSAPKMTPNIMLEGHIANTIARANSSPDEYLIAAQDTTYYNYSGHHQMKGLGVIKDRIKGVMQHNILLMSELGQPLGLLDQQYWTRKGGKNFEGKESEKWFNGLSAVNKHLGNCGKKVVLVEDREADIFDFFKAQRADSIELLVRVYEPRNMEVLASGQIVKLEGATEHLSDYGCKEVVIQRNNREVKLTLSLRAGAVSVHPRKDLSIKKHSTQGLSLVVAEEVACVDCKTGENLFDKKERAIWYLLTSLPIENLEDVQRIVNFYALRWRIERLHYTLKSGALNVEKLQFDDLDTTLNALAFYSIVAWQILSVTYLVRQDAEVPASDFFEEQEIEILKKVSKKEIQTIREAVLALCKIVGFAPSKKQPLPGVKVLAQAFERFYYIKLGANIT